MNYKINAANTGRFSNIIYLSSVDSTNSYLKSNDFPCGTVVFTGTQTAGRGRRGRQWESGGGLCFSFLLRDISSGLRPLLPFICGLAVCGAVGGGAALKWPNDVLLGGQKICGILCEALHFGQSAASVCGIGLNISEKREYFEGLGLPGAGSVYSETGTAPDKAATAEIILYLISDYIEKYENNPQGLISEYKPKCILLGKNITVENAGKVIFGEAADISPDGALIVRTPSGEIAVYSGEASIIVEKGIKNI